LLLDLGKSIASPLSEEKIAPGLIFRLWQEPVIQSGEPNAIAINRAVHYRKLARGGRIGFRRRRNLLKTEASVARGVPLVLNLNFGKTRRRECNRGQKEKTFHANLH
jgi:hypothetical protein